MAVWRPLREAFAKCASWLVGHLPKLAARADDAWRRIQAAYHGWRPESRIYAMALVPSAGSILLAASSDPVAANVFAPAVLLLSLLLLAAGFLTWLVRTVLRWWGTAAGRSAILAFNAAVLLVAVVPARAMVADALGLPPTDFDLTVGICVLLFYPVVALLLLLAVMTVWHVFLLLARWLADEVGDFADWAVATVMRLVFSVRAKPDLTGMIEERSRWGAVLHFAGCGILVATVCIVAYQAREPVLKPLVRNVAYWTEYYEISRYPGIDPTLPAKIHTGAMVSYARRSQTWDVEILGPCRLSDGCARMLGGDVSE